MTMSFTRLLLTSVPIILDYQGISWMQLILYCKTLNTSVSNPNSRRCALYLLKCDFLPSVVCGTCYTLTSQYLAISSGAELYRARSLACCVYILLYFSDTRRREHSRVWLDTATRGAAGARATPRDVSVGCSARGLLPDPLLLLATTTATE